MLDMTRIYIIYIYIYIYIYVYRSNGGYAADSVSCSASNSGCLGR
jgi:hypothetical protein